MRSRGMSRHQRVRGAVAITCALIAAAWSSGAAEASVWTGQNTQNPPNASYAVLSSVSCHGLSHCMAVGSWFGTTPTKSKTLAEDWNGSSYVIVHTPNPSASDDQLFGVSCPGADSCFAVGESLSDAKPIIERWSDGVWSLQPPGHLGTGLNGISCVSVSFCIAVGAGGAGNSVVDGWDGSRWSLLARIRPEGYSGAQLSSVSCSSLTSCVAVGSATDSENAQHLLAATGNGSTWTSNVLAFPFSADQGHLDSVSCPATTSCMGVGSVEGPAVDEAVAEHWNGSTWTAAALPSSEYVQAEAVACASTTACEAVGAVFNNGKTWGANWNGTSWSLDTMPDVPGLAFLYGADCTKSSGCSAVGVWEPGGTSYDIAYHST